MQIPSRPLPNPSHSPGQHRNPAPSPSSPGIGVLVHIPSLVSNDSAVAIPPLRFPVSVTGRQPPHPHPCTSNDSLSPKACQSPPLSLPPHPGPQTPPAASSRHSSSPGLLLTISQDLRWGRAGCAAACGPDPAWAPGPANSASGPHPPSASVLSAIERAWQSARPSSAPTYSHSPASARPQAAELSGLFTLIPGLLAVPAPGRTPCFRLSSRDPPRLSGS
jgi:hypothetical protein